MQSIPSKCALAILLAATASKASAPLPWYGDVRTNDLRQWYELDCGGQGGSCPCPGGGPGSCHTDSTSSPLGAGGRFQIVGGFAGTTDNSLRIELRHGDYWLESSGSATTTRNELVYPERTCNASGCQSDYAVYQAAAGLNDRYFAFSLWFDPSFQPWSCSDIGLPLNQGHCSQSVPNVFNSFFNLHHDDGTGNGGPGSPPFGMGLEAYCPAGDCSAHTYMITLHTTPDRGNTTYYLWSEPLQTGVWYNFTLHAHFATDSTGVLELRMSKGNSVTLAKSNVPLTCPPGSASIPSGGCQVATLDPGYPYSYLKSGLYRDASILDTVVLYHHGWVIGSSLDQVEAPGNPPPSNPPVSTLSDAFAGATIDGSKWASAVQTQGTATEGGGSLHLTPNANTGSAQVYVQSNGVYSLVGSAAFVQVPQVVSSGGSVTNNLALVQDPSNAVSWWYSAGTLTATRTTGGVKTAVVSVPYSSASHAWWRIRESGGTVFWETSSDGQVWTQQGSTPSSNVPFINSVRPMFYLETSGAGSPAPGEARYSNFNVSSAPPPPPGNIAFRAASTYTQISASTMSMDLTVPASVQANDVLIANLYAGDYVEAFLPTITPPPGWTLVKQVADGTRGILQIYSKVATATDAGTTARWTTNIWVGAACSLLAYSGVSAATPVDQSAVQDNPAIASSYSTPSVNTSIANDMMIATYASYSDYTPPRTSWTAPNGTAQRVNVNNNALLSISNDDAIQPGAGPSGTFASTSTPQQTYALTALVALKPGP